MLAVTFRAFMNLLSRKIDLKVRWNDGKANLLTIMWSNRKFQNDVKSTFLFSILQTTKPCPVWTARSWSSMRWSSRSSLKSCNCAWMMAPSVRVRCWKWADPKPSFRCSKARRASTPRTQSASSPATSCVRPSPRTCWAASSTAPASPSTRVRQSWPKIIWTFK